MALLMVLSIKYNTKNSSMRETIDNPDLIIIRTSVLGKIISREL